MVAQVVRDPRARDQHSERAAEYAVAGEKFVAPDDRAALGHLGHQAVRHLAQSFGVQALKVLGYHG